VLDVFARTGWETRASLTHELQMWIEPANGNTAVRILSVGQFGGSGWRDKAEPEEDMAQRRLSLADGLACQVESARLAIRRRYDRNRARVLNEADA
jgi:hypothetical protein